jgi:hypothetical protein
MFIVISMAKEQRKGADKVAEMTFIAKNYRIRQQLQATPF